MFNTNASSAFFFYKASLVDQNNIDVFISFKKIIPTKLVYLRIYMVSLEDLSPLIVVANNQSP